MSMANGSRIAKQDFEKREHVRSSVGLPAVVRVGDQDHSARIANIAPGGAMIETSVHLLPGTPLSLRCGTICTSAVVIWTKSGQTGINFTRWPRSPPRTFFHALSEHCSELSENVRANVRNGWKAGSSAEGKVDANVR